MAQISPNNGPDWAVIGGAIATAIIAAAGAWVSLRGSFKKPNEHDALRMSRDQAATDNTALTLDNVWKLVNELQEERGRCADRIDVLEHEVDTLKLEIANLKAELIRLRQ